MAEGLAAEDEVGPRFLLGSSSGARACGCSREDAASLPSFFFFVTAAATAAAGGGRGAMVKSIDSAEWSKHACAGNKQ